MTLDALRPERARHRLRRFALAVHAPDVIELHDKRHGELLELLESLRTRWPDQRLHLVMDNFSPHRHPDVRDWAAVNDVELVFLPTYSS